MSHSRLQGPRRRDAPEAFIGPPRRARPPPSRQATAARGSDRGMRSTSPCRPGLGLRVCGPHLLAPLGCPPLPPAPDRSRSSRTESRSAARTRLAPDRHEGRRESNVSVISGSPPSGSFVSASTRTSATSSSAQLRSSRSSRAAMTRFCSAICRSFSVTRSYQRNPAAAKAPRRRSVTRALSFAFTTRV
jgi:hypothetical protein